MPTPKQVWESCMPPTELPIEIGQKRQMFVDGFGEMEGIITNFDDNVCAFVDEDWSLWVIEWNSLSPMTHIGLLVNGEELKRIMEEEANSVALIDNV